MKTAGYLVFAAVYYICRLIFKVDSKKVFCIMTHDGSEDSSVGVIVSYLKTLNCGYHFEYIRKQDANAGKGKAGLRGMASFFLVKPFHLATAGNILEDNIFLPMAYLKFRSSVNVVQLWHGTGTIKKFGQSVNTGRLGKLEKRANQTITHLIVNSLYTKKLYMHAFGVSEENVYVLGLPRTDIMFDQRKKEAAIGKFYQEYPELMGKRILLYAPTFRDREKDNPRIELDFSYFIEHLSGDEVLIVRFHPHVGAAFDLQWGKMGITDDRIMNLSGYENLGTLLFVSDLLITDYSSIIFEYCILERPMVFYAYDLDAFSLEGRGFYEKYEEYVPGPVVKTTEELIEAIHFEASSKDRIQEFRDSHFSYLDGQSTERVVKQIFFNNN